jgi:hypothetical protein
LAEEREREERERRRASNLRLFDKKTDPAVG